MEEIWNNQDSYWSTLTEQWREKGHGKRGDQEPRHSTNLAFMAEWQHWSLSSVKVKEST